MTALPLARLATATPPRATQRAFTLTELLVVTILLGLAAVVATPSASVGDSRKLDLSATEIANAIRFARSEAMRTGEAKGFHHEKDAKTIRVFSIDTSISPLDIEFDVYHPVDKNIYKREFTEQPFAFDGTILKQMSFRGTCDALTTVYFDAGGTPWCADPANVLLEQFEITLTLGTRTRVVTLHGINGRVTIL